MLSLVLAVLAGSLLCWPGGAGRRRVRVLIGDRSPTPRWLRKPGYVLAGTAIGLSLLGVLVFAGAAAVCGLLLLFAAGLAHWRAGRRANEAVRGTREFAEALRALVAELRRGAPAELAVRTASLDVAPDAARTLARLAATSSGVAGPGSASISREYRNPVLRRVVPSLSTVWELAQRYGLPLADMLDAVRADVDRAARTVARTTAKMAGPRASAGVLAGLPIAGVGLGTAIGAAPLTVLVATGTGQLLLIVGCAFVLAGVAWTNRLTGYRSLR